MYNHYGEKEFWDDIPEDCQKAIKELYRLKVFTCCAWDHEENFADVWWLVLHEVDMYAEGEFCKEARRSRDGIGEPDAMSLAQAKRADAWLIRWLDLFNEYKDKTSIRNFNEGYYYYGGQI